jgi:hypothetical protein
MDFPGKNKKVGLSAYRSFSVQPLKAANSVRRQSDWQRFATVRWFHHIADLGYEVKDYGDVGIVTPEYIASKEENPKYLKEILASYENIAHDIKKFCRLMNSCYLGGVPLNCTWHLSAISSFFESKKRKSV